MTIAEFVKVQRMALGLTQPLLAQQAGVGLRFLRELERGKESIRLDKLNQVLAFFGTKAGVVRAQTGLAAGIPAEEVAQIKGEVERKAAAKHTRKGTNASIGQGKKPKAKHGQRPQLLVLCGRNKKRSRTAEFIFKNDERFSIRSAGLSPKSNRKVNQNDLQWADLVLVMEHKHRSKLADLFREQALPPVAVLDIPDEFEFLDLPLIELLSEKINAAWQQYFEHG